MRPLNNMPRKKTDYKEILKDLSQKAKTLENKAILSDLSDHAEIKPKRKSQTETSFPNEKVARKKNEMGFQIQNATIDVPRKHYSK